MDFRHSTAVTSTDNKPKKRLSPGESPPTVSEKAETSGDSADKNIPYRQKRIVRAEFDSMKAFFESERGLAEIMKRYDDIKFMYSASRSRNKMLTDELTALNEEMGTLKSKEREDNELIEALMIHQRQLRDVLDRDRHLCDSTFQHQYGKLEEMHKEDVQDVALLHDVREAVETKQDGCEIEDECGCTVGDLHMKLEREKFKTLLESSLEVKQTLDQMVNILRKRIEDVSRQVVDAQAHCEEQRVEIKKLNQELEALKRSGKAIPKSRETEDKSARGVLLREQLQLVREENEYLRGFLQKAVTTKEDDFRLYQSTMENAKQHYLRNLEEIKSSVATQN